MSSSLPDGRALVISDLTLFFRRWKHAASCHKGSRIEGETDIFVEDVFHAEAIRTRSTE